MGTTQTTYVRSARMVAREVREIVLAPPPEPVAFLPGQWLSLHLRLGEPPPLVRAYTLAAPPHPSGELVLCLDRVPGGLGSDYLFAITPGEPVTFGGPLGRFVLPDDPGDLLWLARFTGIVPFRAMLAQLREQPPSGKVTLVYTAPSIDDMPYLDEFRAAETELEWFRLIPSIEDVDLLLPGLLPDGAAVVPMICGVQKFVRPLRDFFAARGFDKKAVKWENYD